MAKPIILKLTSVCAPFIAWLPIANSQQSYCFDQQCVGCANPAPRLCPPENIFTYYDCCIDGCCQFVKWPNLIFLVVVIIALLAGCICCCFFLVSEANQKRAGNDTNQSSASRRRKKSARRHLQDNQIATIEQNVGRSPATPIPPPRYGDNRRSTVV
ncbi:hypothetical protein M3Y97_00101000 [Aphelenchoides bicaudatus]|nr:hypothetical protein M3Y97_00101000 [Aphelenchoides bicaudatus]